MGKTDKFSSFSVNGKLAKNRFVRSATNSHLCNTDGTVSNAEIEMYDSLGRGDIGTIITGHMSVAPGLEYRADIAQPSIGSDDFIRGIRRVADTIHKYGSLAIAQISLAGPKGLTTFDFNELPTEDMEHIRDWFIEAAVRTQKSGFDGVQVHMAHWYLLAAVVNTGLNRRTDKYGGTDENIIRLPMEIISGIRKKCGADFLIYVKLNAHNTPAGADDLDLLGFYVGKLQSAGIDLVEISNADFTRQPRQEECYYLDAAEYLRRQFPELPMSLVGGIYTEAAIDRVLLTTDFVSLSRTLLTQPDFIVKLRNGEALKSRCVHCNKCFEIFATKYERCVFGPVNEKLEETFGNYH